MFQPVLVPVDLALDGREERLLDLARGRAGLTDLAVVDRADRHDLRGGTAEERFLARVEVAAQDVTFRVVDAEVLDDRLDRVLGDAFEGARAGRRRDDASVPDDEDV